MNYESSYFCLFLRNMVVIKQLKVWFGQLMASNIAYDCFISCTKSYTARLPEQCWGSAWGSRVPHQWLQQAHGPSHVSDHCHRVLHNTDSLLFCSGKGNRRHVPASGFTVFHRKSDHSSLLLYLLLFYWESEI